MLHPSLLESIFHNGENHPIQMTFADVPSSVLETGLHTHNWAQDKSLAGLPFLASILAALFLFVVILPTFRAALKEVSTEITMAPHYDSAMSTSDSLQTFDESKENRMTAPMQDSASEEKEANYKEDSTHYHFSQETDGTEATSNTSSVNKFIEDRMSVTTTAPSSTVSSADSLQSIDESEGGPEKEQVLIRVCNGDDDSKIEFLRNQDFSQDFTEEKDASTTIDLSSTQTKSSTVSEAEPIAKKEVQVAKEARMDRLPVYDEDDVYDADEPCDLDELSRATPAHSSIPVTPDRTYLPRKLSSKISRRRKYVRVTSSGASVSSEITIS
ncbi:hypothetical protein HJC23_008677 [Cyclotella cryptica]|uniref:Uncharacterized protein n=1 Tax=Cyclotella cryptica TaxID=29204 RepID=A0ABD3QGK9_9STRA|eukprot:CCRYP_005380-RA/>CCRYP_005380-RA protein AED:0.12 eAED:0.12 QI:0/-1/0/1/-1/1/1/0/327